MPSLTGAGRNLPDRLMVENEISIHRNKYSIIYEISIYQSQGFTFDTTKHWQW